MKRYILSTLLAMAIIANVQVMNASALAVGNNDSWIQNPTNGHTYKLIPYMNWSQAETMATDVGGHLVTINDRQEEQWLRNQFGANSLFWIGFNDIGLEGNWEWSSGESSVYTNWALGEPNNRSGDGRPENAAVMNWGNHINGNVVYGDSWNDVPTDIANQGIIEVTPSPSPTFEPIPTPVPTTVPTTYPRIYDESTWGPIGIGTKYVWNFETCQDCETISIGDGELGNVLNIPIDHNNRIIPEKTLTYRTIRQTNQFRVNEMTGLNVERALNSNFTKASGIGDGAGYYAKIMILNNKFIALNGKANKIAKLVLEQGTAPEDYKDLAVGETWSIGDGYTLTAQSIDARVAPKQVWLIFKDNGIKKDDKVISENQVYAYAEKSIVGETDVPLFVTYIDNIYSGGTTDVVRLRYTWLVSDNDFMTINNGNRTGGGSVFIVKNVSDNQLVLWNENSSINLLANSTVSLIDRLKFVVEDDINNLKFYPFIDNISNIPEEGGWIQNPTNDHYYKLAVPMRWQQAEARAVELGGHLVTINDRQEELWLRDQFGTNELFWIGFNDLRIEGNWEWSSGEYITYTNWDFGEPNNRAGNGMVENAAVMNWDGYINDTVIYGDKWNDVADGTYRGIVEVSSITEPVITPTPTPINSPMPTPTATPTPITIYDINENGRIDKGEAINAITDYFSGTITRQQAIDVLMSYFNESF